MEINYYILFKTHLKVHNLHNKSRNIIKSLVTIELILKEIIQFNTLKQLTNEQFWIFVNNSLSSV